MNTLTVAVLVTTAVLVFIGVVLWITALLDTRTCVEGGTKHIDDHAWGDVTCLLCGRQAYVEYGR